MPQARSPATTVIIVGAGATMGSGYTRSGITLPGDRGFFANRVVRSMLAGGRYTALPLALQAFAATHGDDPETLRLEQLWHWLLGGPDLAHLRDAWQDAVALPVSRVYDEHHLARSGREDAAAPVDPACIAEWELRCLIGHVYEKLSAPADNPWKHLMARWDIARTHASVFISLNFDTVLETALERQWAPWHYPHIPATTRRSADFIRVLKPRGSLNWCLRQDGDALQAFTNYHLTPIRGQSQGPAHWQSALLVPPGAQGQPDTVRTLCEALRESAAQALGEATRVIVAGHGFDPQDADLQALLHKARALREGRPFDEVEACTLADGNEEALRGRLQQWLPARRFQLHTQGLQALAAT